MLSRAQVQGLVDFAVWFGKLLVCAVSFVVFVSGLGDLGFLLLVQTIGLPWWIGAITVLVVAMAFGVALGRWQRRRGSAALR